MAITSPQFFRLKLDDVGVVPTAAFGRLSATDMMYLAKKAQFVFS
jgi:hypothetical protein